MSTVIYAAIAVGDDRSGYRATFPDFPDCSASGKTLGELIANARGAASAHLKRLADEGREWPPAAPIDQVRPGEGGAVFLVDAQVDDSPVRVNISIGEQLLKRLDAAAEARGTTRSGFIAASVRASLGEKARGVSADIEAAARQIQDELTAFGRKIGEQLGPESAFSRNISDLDDKVLEAVRKAADGVSAAIARRREASGRTPPPAGDDPDGTAARH